MNNNPFKGVNYLFDGFKLLLKPGIKRFVIIPLLINIILFATLFILAKHYFGVFNHWFTLHLPHWLAWLGSILWVIFFFGFFLVMIYTFVTLANLIAAPFNSLLAEKVQLYLTGKVQEQSLLSTLKDVPRIMGRQLAILGYYLPRAIVVLILFFVPVIQLVAAIIWFLFNASFMTITYIDYPTDNNRIPLRVILMQLKSARWLSLGFGSAVLVLTMIPVVNFFVIPAAVAGATKLWIEQYKLN
ncbi:MAG: sulfate transporter CysZ [Gammaproteobacteria bacterium]